MPVTTPADVRKIAPEFAFIDTYTDSEIQLAIDTATGQLSPEAWGASYDLAVKWLAAHFLAVSHPEQSQTQKIRSWEETGSTDDVFLGITRFGAVFKQLRTSQIKIRMPVVIPGGNF